MQQRTVHMTSTKTEGFWIQWGFEIRTSLDFKWLIRGWVENGLDLEWDLKLESPIILNQDKWVPFCKKPFEIRTWTSSFQKVRTLAIAWPFENQTIWNLTSKKSGFQMFPDFEWSDFRSPLHCLLFKGPLVSLFLNPTLPFVTNNPKFHYSLIHFIKKLEILFKNYVYKQ